MRMNFNQFASLCLISCGLGQHCAAEISVTNQPFPGIAIYSETRTNPPTRLFVAEVDLTNPKVHLHVARGGADPDGPGKWQTTLMRPTKIAAREKFDLVVNGDFFDARGIRDAEGTNSAYRSEIWSKVTGPAMSNGKAWSTSANARPCLVVSKRGRPPSAKYSNPIRMIGKSFPATSYWCAPGRLCHTTTIKSGIRAPWWA